MMNEKDDCFGEICQSFNHTSDILAEDGFDTALGLVTSCQKWLKDWTLDTFMLLAELMSMSIGDPPP